MKFAFISLMEAAPWGGSEELWAQTAANLRNSGHSVIASVKDWGESEAENLRRLERDGVHLARRREVRTPTFGQIVTHRIRRRFGLEEASRPNFAAIADERPDLVLVSLGCGLAGRESCGVFIDREIPFAVLSQAAAEQWWPDDTTREDFASVARAARALFFVSERNRQLLSRQMQFSHPVAEVVRNPFRVPYQRQFAWPTSTSPLRLAFVGRLEPAAKGCDLLMDVLAQEKWRSRDIRISFFGGGAMTKSMNALARELGLTQVDFHGHVSDVAAIWRDHHALVLPSRFEGLPTAIVEALLCGRPCIVTDVAGNAELIEDNVTGFVAAAPTIPLLDEAMERAWAARSTWPEMGRRAAGIARQHVPADPAAIFAGRLLRLASLPR